MVLLFSAAPATADDPAPDDTIAAALEAAGNGDDTQLAALLEGDSVVETQIALRAWLDVRGDFAPERLQGPDQQPGAAQPLSTRPGVQRTGQYDNYCTSYAGVTMGWNGKAELACHGWMDSYISGNHVAHYCPDLIPRGAPISIGCAYAIGSAILSATGIGSIGWAAYGVGLLVSGGGIVISCP